MRRESQIIIPVHFHLFILQFHMISDFRHLPKLFDSGFRHVSASYFGVDPSVGAIPIIAERVSLPAQLSSVPFVPLLSPTLAKVYEKPSSVLLVDMART